MLFVDVKILLGEKSFVGRANLHFQICSRGSCVQDAGISISVDY